ncbi:hypothetical protein [Ruegeria sp. HKCCD7255]|uniref:hypothetical protein n=1 Tax=Ruegeria sp. HKCCD7255 TaxID=2683004 RepID=UPI0014894E03|nr:hypothetical protein [Ruegeria sp. HKCCD7255]
MKTLDSEPIGLGARLLSLLAAFVFLDQWLDHTTPLTTAQYKSVSVALAFLTSSWVATIGAVSLFALVILFKPIRRPWSEEQLESGWRVFSIGVAGMLAWWLVTLGPNHAHGQTYIFDRLLILAFLVASYRWPIFLLPFVVLAYALAHQISVPAIGGPVLPHKLLLLEGVCLIVVWQVLRGAGLPIRRKDALLLLACLIAGRYWYPGYGKFMLDWTQFAHVQNAVYSAYGHGFTNWLPVETVTSFAGYLGHFSWLMIWFVLLFELGFLLMVVNRWATLLLIAAAILFHFGVFVLFGFLFWTWIVMDILFVYLLLRHVRLPETSPYSLWATIVSIPLIILTPIWSDPSRLAWFDTGMSYVTRFYAVGQSGQMYQLSPKFFQPYDDNMKFSFFGYLYPDRATLAGPYGASSDLDVARAVQDAKTPEEIFAIETERAAEKPGNEERIEIFHDLLREYIANWNDGCMCKPWWSALQPPPQFWTYPWSDELPVYVAQEPIREVQIIGVTTWFNGETIQEIRREDAGKVEIPL